MTIFSRIGLLLLALCIGLPAFANPAPQWKLIQRVGEVWITSDQFQPIAVTTNGVIPEKSVIVTGQRGRVVLSRGTEQIIMQPNSRLVIPETKGNTTRLEQTRGAALFRIDRKSLPHFQVDTPFLAAVVKGTIFYVTVSEKAASVQVTEGAVSVATAKGGAQTLVKPGMIAEVRATSSVVIDLTDEGGRKRRITEREAPRETAPTERLDWGPGGSDSGDGAGGGGIAAPGKEAAFNNIQLRKTIVTDHSRQVTLLRTSAPEVSLAEFITDAATGKQLQMAEDKRTARFSNLEHLVDTDVVGAAAKGLEKVRVASGKDFLKSSKVKVESGFVSTAIQNLIIGGVGLLILFQLGKTLTPRKRT